jgi:hypothetical protein
MGKISWSIASSIDKDYIFELAVTKGWLNDPPQVQVKKYPGMEEWYVIEPYEGPCNCPNLVYPPEELRNGR